MFGGVFAALLTARRRQFRSRRPGRSITPTPPSLVGIERELLVNGPAGVVQSEFLDLALRALASAISGSQAGMPDVLAAGMGPQRLDLRLRTPQFDPPDPFTVDETAMWWSVPTTAHFDPVLRETQLAPLPTLVTIGHRGDSRWMLDLESVAMLTLTGPTDRARALARFIAAELATNAWSDTVAVTVVGVGQELVTLNPERVRAGSDPDTELARHQDHITRQQDLRARSATDALGGRVHDIAGDSWMPRVLVLDRHGHPGSPQKPTFPGVDTGGRLAAALVVVGTHPNDPHLQDQEGLGQGAGAGLVVELDDHGGLSIENLALTAEAEGLSPQDAAGIANVVATARDSGDIAMTPMTGATAWSRFVATDGSLLPSLTEPRQDAAVPEDQHEAHHQGSSLLPLPDEVYLATAATTADDLASLAPCVPADVRARLEKADPDLDYDVAAWWSPDCDRPRLTLLGPARLRALGEQPEKTVAACVELAAYMAMRPKVQSLQGAVHPAGVTSDEVATALRVKQTSARTVLSKLRTWLGDNPHTGRRHLPDAVRGQASGAGVYVVEDLLVDVDLMLRLRARAQARGGADGMGDLRAALDLVAGEPFTQLRSGGWTWVTDGDRPDHYCTAAIVAIAHLLVADALVAGDTALARAAAQTAQLAAPYEETPRVDLVAVREAEQDQAAAELDLRVTVLDRVDDEHTGPEGPSERTRQIIERRGWLRQTG